ncbi:hypothetical protein [Arthrobacter monumenti]
MRHSARKKLGLLAVGAVLSLTAGLISVPAASAATRPVEVTGFTANNMVFSSSDCKYNTVKVKRTVSSSVEDFYIDTDVTRNGYIKNFLMFGGSDVSERMLICGSDGLGAYKIGPSDIFGYKSNYDFLDYTDRTAKTFYVRGKAKAGISSARKGNYVTVNVSARYYNPSAYKYSYYSPTGVKIQRKTTSGWKTIKTVSLSSGKASYRTYKPGKAYYRAVLPQRAKTTSDISATTLR